MIGTDVAQASKLLKQGEVVAIPTETVYGLAANALNPEAVTKIYDAKERPSFNPLILHVASLEAASSYVTTIHPLAKQLADHFWPGSLSILFPKSEVVPNIVTAGLPNVVLRVPNHQLTLQLLKGIDFPLAAPSANISNTVSPTSAQRVYQNLGERIPYILDGGSCEVGLESTIVSVIDNEVIILREGGISKEDIETELGVQVSYQMADKVTAPGQLKRHYATNKPLYVVDDINESLKEFKDQKASVLLFKDSNPSAHCSYFLSQSYNLSEIAINLFEMMNRADEDDSDLILVERVKNEGIGKAINDRLERASS
jgi:L-threonylcarbamoyladenylate synthase